MTCRCGSMQCYVCRKPVRSYKEHFCQHVTEVQKCKECTKCILFEDVQKVDQAIVEMKRQQGAECLFEQGYSAKGNTIFKSDGKATDESSSVAPVDVTIPKRFYYAPKPKDQTIPVQRPHMAETSNDAPGYQASGESSGVAPIVRTIPKHFIYAPKPKDQAIPVQRPHVAQTSNVASDNHRYQLYYNPKGSCQQGGRQQGILQQGSRQQSDYQQGRSQQGTQKPGGSQQYGGQQGGGQQGTLHPGGSQQDGGQQGTLQQSGCQQGVFQQGVFQRSGRQQGFYQDQRPSTSAGTSNYSNPQYPHYDDNDNQWEDDDHYY